MGLGLVALGSIFLAGGLFLLLPSLGGPFPQPVLSVVGAGVFAVALAALAFGLGTLARPALVVHLGQDGLRPALGPVVPWSKILGASLVDFGGTQLPVVHVDQAYTDRDPGLSGWRRKGWELTRRSSGTDVPLRHAAAGGDEEVVRLIYAACARMAGRP